jgi:CheY-like chemotaxis protein/DNA-directed RNA polymerase specialized sigma24 family protein
MVTGDAVAKSIPQLRRMARLLAGARESGDAVVAATLETLADGAAEEIGADPRIALYRMFCRFWNGPLGQQVRGLATPMPSDLALQQRLVALTPRSRLAFMLLAVEGFTLEAAAEVLEQPLSEAAALVEAARSEVASQLATDILIIEDEPLIAIDLERLMLELGHRVTGIARTHREAVASARAQRPGLILADIRLADGSNGIDAANEILTWHRVPVVFVTAYPELLLTGQGPEPTFLMSKPFNVDDVRVVVSQALFFEPRPEGQSSNPAR